MARNEELSQVLSPWSCILDYEKLFFKVYLGGKMTSKSWQQTIVFSVVIFDAGFCQLAFTLQVVYVN